jgi:hypothetical protein
VFRRRKPDESNAPSPGPGLRQTALSVTADELGLDPADAGPVWGVLMDTRFADGGWFTLVTFADGTTSLYTSALFGIIGAGQHEEVRQASSHLRALAGARLAVFEPSSDTELPAPGWVTIRARTFQGQMTVSAPEEQLGGGSHPASDVFFAAHEVIGRARMIVERGDAGRP